VTRTSASESSSRTSQIDELASACAYVVAREPGVFRANASLPRAAIAEKKILVARIDHSCVACEERHRRALEHASHAFDERLDAGARSPISAVSSLSRRSCSDAARAVSTMRRR
jgi:hypothetical protein